MGDKALYLLAQYDEATSAQLAHYYQALTENGWVGRQTKNVPYHITLGCYGTGEEEQAAASMAAFCREKESFDIRLSHIGLFGLNVLFIEPVMNDELWQMHRYFFAYKTNADHLWSPHTTLLMEEPDIVLQAIPVLARHFTPLTARIESIALYEFFPARFIAEYALR